ncbi:MAG: sodium ion-translocating decarboxylase subunit beta [Clostridiales bacterium]|nr:sodium ion-translocating decarboxylase subunit beta [Clostridiales bacterium]
MGGFNFVDMMKNLWHSTGFYQSSWQNYVMMLIACVLLFVGIGLKKEPLLLVPIGFGMLFVNIPGAYGILMKEPTVLEDGTSSAGGLLYYMEKGVEWVIFPPLIFLGIGAMTDFGPLIASPKSFICGAAAQLGIFFTLFGAIWIGFDGAQAAAISIIGGADGPTSIYVTTMLKQFDLLPAITVAAYSYMALIPIIQPPLMKWLTTKKERSVRMEQLRPVSKREKIVFPIVVTLVCGLIIPDSLPLLGMLMFGNLLKECLVADRLANTASNGLMNGVTIFLGICVGAKAFGDTFLTFDTLKIVALGLLAFVMGTVGGILVAKLMYLATKGKVNPLIGSAGVSAVPMAARVSQTVAQKEDPNNYLLMHAMGPNVAGVIGSAVAAGVLLSIFA